VVADSHGDQWSRIVIARIIAIMPNTIGYHLVKSTYGQWLADQTTKAVHRETDHQGPVWCKGKWRTFIFDPSHWDNATVYIQRHNTRHGLPVRPYGFIQ